MTAYLLIESRDPREVAAVAHDRRLALDLVRAGHAVTLFLVQNGVFPARAGGPDTDLRALVDGGVTVLGDEFSLRERGIGEVAGGIRVAKIDTVVDALTRGDRTLWL